MFSGFSDPNMGVFSGQNAHTEGKVTIEDIVQALQSAIGAKSSAESCQAPFELRQDEPLYIVCTKVFGNVWKPSSKIFNDEFQARVHAQSTEKQAENTIFKVTLNELS